MFKNAFVHTWLVRALNFKFVNEILSRSVILCALKFPEAIIKRTIFFILFFKGLDTFLAESVPAWMCSHGADHKLLTQWAFEMNRVSV
jgi:hypothetical protein